MCLKLIPQVTPLNVGELKVLEGTHGPDPMELWRGEVGLENHTNKDTDTKPKCIWEVETD